MSAQGESECEDGAIVGEGSGDFKEGENREESPLRKESSEVVKSSPASPGGSGQNSSEVAADPEEKDTDKVDDLEIIQESSVQNDVEALREAENESSALSVSGDVDETSRNSAMEGMSGSAEEGQMSGNSEVDGTSQNSDVVHLSPDEDETPQNPEEDETSQIGGEKISQNIEDETSQNAEEDKTSQNAEGDETSQSINVDETSRNDADETSQDVDERNKMSAITEGSEGSQNSKGDETSQPAASADETSMDESTQLSSSQEEPAKSDDDVNTQHEDKGDNSEQKISLPSLSQAEEDKLLAMDTGDENSRTGEENSEIMNQEKDEGIGLQISSVTGGEKTMEADNEDKDSEKKSSGAETDSKVETADKGNDSVVAMDMEESGSLSAMVISEPRTISEENMEVTNVEGEASEKKEAHSSTKMEVDEKVEGDKKKTESGDVESSSSSKVENLISENDNTGFKIVSVSEAKDAAEEITIDDDSEKKNSSEKTKKDADESGPKILATTSLSETPQRVTRSQSGSKTAPPKVDTPAQQKTELSTPQSVKATQKCIVCGKNGKCKYNIVRNGDVKHLCNDRCFKSFRSMPTKYLRADKNIATATAAPVPVYSSNNKYRTCCVCQLMNVNPNKPYLNWSSMDFCGEECLSKYKKQMKSTCGQCFKTLPAAQWATFCLKVGNEVKQFCNSDCYLTFKAKTKVCAYCKKDATRANGKFKNCCSDICLKKFEKEQDEDVEIIGVQPGSKDVACAVCLKITKPKHELTFEGKLHKMCSDPCYSAFQYANKLTSNTCDNCGVYCYGEGSSPQFIQFEGYQKRFCCTNCVNTFRSVNKKMVQCAWCGLRKTNFDMIERVDANNKYQLFCSLNCLSLYRVNLQATSNQSVTCDQCRKFVPAQYHLTMSDASVRNFCSYSCVMTFQGQFGTGSKQAPPKKNTAVGPKPPSADTRTSPRAVPKPPPANAAAAPPAMSGATSLNPRTVNSSSQPRTQTVNIKSPGQMPLVINAQTQAVKTTSNQQQIIIQPPPPKQVKNKSLLCKPYVQTKATSCRPSTQTKETQTDEDAGKPVLIPVPVPVYIPTPMAMYSCPTPVPLPIPVPIPIPCFIPTTKKSSASILKHIKDILEKIPADPFEAELLRMAEAVATAEKGSDNESVKSDDEMAVGDVVDGKEPLDVKPGTKETEEDMLQMALRMATEMSEPADLESLVDPLPLNSNNEAAAPELLPVEDVEQILSPRERRARNRKATTKRSSSSKGARRSKRQRLDSDSETAAEVQEEAPAQKGSAADAHFLLKYMYGVNAWKHWVVQKNTQLEKVMNQGSGRVKLFKTELLQCTADELNYSLCLFVKEVRKPNGDEYAADSILYLCLGIQNYLFENGRIDNIFTDVYYEKFTECLNEVVQRFKPKLNSAGQLVCRIEEEHLWECKQLGAHSPHVLLNTLVYFNTKYFRLRTPEDHMKLSFSHIMKHWKKNPGAPPTLGAKSTVGRSVYLRYYAGTPSKQAQDKDKKKKEEHPVLEQAENQENPLRCPVKLYEFYLSKCSYFSSPESLKTRSDIFYLVPERSCVPDSPVWYSTQPMTVEPMAKMLNRIHLVKEVQEAYANVS